MFSNETVAKLQAARAARFAKYGTLTVDRPSLELIERLFVNPDCMSDVPLTSLQGEKVRMFDLGQHIITAAPSTLSQYAERHDVESFTVDHVLKCFAIDHASDLAHNHIPDEHNPYYALAHLLNVSTVDAIGTIESTKTCTASTVSPWGTVQFKHLVIPETLHPVIGQKIYHHFGVVVGIVDDELLATDIIRLQKHDSFIEQLMRTATKSHITIDFGDATFFGRDVVGQIVKKLPATTKKSVGDLTSTGQVRFLH